MDIPGITKEDEFTELTDFHPDRVDLVGKAANGTTFLIAKGDGSAGLLDPEFVRGLVSKEAPVPEPSEPGETTLANGIVLKGSPAAVAAFIRAASERPVPTPADVAKAKYSADDKQKMLAAGQAIKNENGDPAYPIGDADDLGKAISAVGRGGSDHDHIRAYVIRRAKALGKSSMIPANWNADGSLKSDVSKEAGVADPVAKDAGDTLDAAIDAGQDGLDPTVPAAAPDDLDGIPGDPTDPGSPAWEAVDAATACKWTQIIAAGKRAVCWLMDRELLEAATVDPDDADNACDLASVLDALDYAISVLAPFAVSEQSEADGGALEMVGKSAEPLTVVAAMVAIAKAGRVLSSANEAKIRNAAKELTDVLASLPQAPADSSSPAAVTKEEATVPQTDPVPVAKDAAPSADEQAKNTGPVNAGGTAGLGEPRTTGPAESLPADGPQASLPGDVPGRVIVKAALPVVLFDHAGNLTGIAPADAVVQKADGDKQMMAVFDQSGNLVGVVDSSKVQPVSGAGKKDEPAKPDGMPADAPAPDDGAQPGPAAAAAPAAADGEDLEPQPSADAGTPADGVAKSGDATQADASTGMQDVVKAVTEQVAKALETSEAAHQEVVAKMAADKAEQAKEIEALKARLETVENTPAMPKVALNGAVPPAQLRGQDQGAGGQVDVTKAAALKDTLYNGSGPAQAQAFHELEGMAIARFHELRNGQRSPAAAG